MEITPISCFFCIIVSLLYSLRRFVFNGSLWKIHNSGSLAKGYDIQPKRQSFSKSIIHPTSKLSSSILTRFNNNFAVANILASDCLDLMSGRIDSEISVHYHRFSYCTSHTYWILFLLDPVFPSDR